MKLINFKKDWKNTLGVMTARGVADCSLLEGSGIPVTMRQALAMGREETIRVLAGPVEKCAEFLDPEEIEYAPAVDDPEKILCIGKNYLEHARETVDLFVASPSPEVFAKFRNTLTPHKGKVRLNPNSRKHDYEAEIAVVIGRTIFNVSPEEAEAAVFGYTLANDVSARDLQKAASQWTPGKTCDTFCPLGPCILTADEVPWDGMVLTGFKNGELRQKCRSAEMMRGIPELVSFLSGCMTLQPGDLVLTGTPAGVILGRPEDKRDWLRAGDVLTVSEEHIGTLTVTVTE